MSTERERELLKDALVKIRTLRARLDASERARHEPIAIVGAGCRFPGGADSPEAYWELIRDGVDAVTDVPAGRWDREAFYDPDPEAPGKAYVRQAGFLRDVAGFDADFFGIPPREAIQLDPQQRLLLEVSWQALENAAAAPDRLSGSVTGVYFGLMNSEHGYRHAQGLAPADIDPYALTGNDLSFPAGRLSYFLGLQGPAMVVTTACSSSLVAVHLACQALRGGECDQALAGGVSLMLDPATTVMLSKLGALAKDGRSKAFDASADGYGRGEGCGVVVLKRLSDAVAAGDRIQAVIRGSAVNHDGPSAGLTVPSGSAQEKLLRQAVKAAGVDPADVAYVEAHGTGTALGDPIEVRAMAKVFGAGRSQPLRIGSVKSNVGHLEGAAGIAGLMKVMLALERASIPPQIHFHNPNPHIPWRDLAVEVATGLRDWPAPSPSQPARRLAGVSSFGLSGVNAHVVIEEAPPAETWQQPASRTEHVLALSAKTGEALARQISLYDHYLEETPGVNWADVCATANTGRAHFRHRTAIVAASVAEARGKLAIAAGRHSKTNPAVGFLFAGAGTLDREAARELYETQAVFRRTIDRCDEMLQPQLDQPLLEVLSETGEAAEPVLSGSLHRGTALAEPAWFALQCALVELWKSWGIEPEVVAGQGVGEFSAAYAAGVFSLEDGLKLVVAQASAAEALSTQLASLGGSVAARQTAAVSNDLAQLDRSIHSAAGERGLVIGASAEGSRTVTVACAESASQPANDLGAGGSGPHFGGPARPSLDEFDRTARQVCYAAPRVRVLSSLSGTPVQRELTTPTYWRRLFDGAAASPLEPRRNPDLQADVVVEIGPLASPESSGEPCRGFAGRSQMLASLAELYARGADIDWQALEQGQGRRWRKLALPTYPFQHQRFWAFDNERKPAADIAASSAESAAASRNREPSPAEQARRLPAAERTAFVQRAFRAYGGKVLGLQGPADGECSLIELGLDSLMTAELKSWISKLFGVSLELKELLSDRSIDELAARIGERLDTTESSAAASNASEAAAASQAAPSRQYPLSEGQKALWFIHQSAPESPAYNVGVALRTASRVDPEALRDSLQGLLDRHPCLRTTFANVDGEPVQVVADRRPFALSRSKRRASPTRNSRRS